MSIFCCHPLKSTQVVYQKFHLGVKLYWILPETPRNSKTVRMLLSTTYFFLIQDIMLFVMSWPPWNQALVEDVLYVIFEEKRNLAKEVVKEVTWKMDMKQKLMGGTSIILFWQLFPGSTLILGSMLIRNSRV